MANQAVNLWGRAAAVCRRLANRMGGVSRGLQLGQLATRAAAQTGLITANTYQVAHGHLVGVFCVGCAISWVWWANAGHAGRSTDRLDGIVYGLGAGVGSVVGLWLSRWVYE